ncbi:hypothetical protein ACFFSH_31755 [Streptomyces filamentosus]|uniref:Uncharacterized protein n=1 Tax=Streptomyces filamentosus TaxID=67294 RepID=A0A919BU71_STRFL|nr:hypothetical protein [Streptomyces filamentosus]GHG13502.1 hypothetical protein GCM10017667_54260 [Streptomyces filamentosus]
MPDLTEQQMSELKAAAAAAAVVPAHQAVAAVMCRMASVDPVTGRKESTASLLNLVRGDETEMRAAFEVAGRMLAGDTRPDGQVVPVGSAAGDPMMTLACDVIRMGMRGEPERAWAQLGQQHPARRAAIFSILISFINYHFAGLDPLALATAE